MSITYRTRNGRTMKIISPDWSYDETATFTVEIWAKAPSQGIERRVSFGHNRKDAQDFASAMRAFGHGCQVRVTQV